MTIEIKNLTKQYNNILAVKNINFKINKGSKAIYIKDEKELDPITKERILTLEKKYGVEQNSCNVVLPDLNKELNYVPITLPSEGKVKGTGTSNV